MDSTDDFGDFEEAIYTKDFFYPAYDSKKDILASELEPPSNLSPSPISLNTKETLTELLHKILSSGRDTLFNYFRSLIDNFFYQESKKKGNSPETDLQLSRDEYSDLKHTYFLDNDSLNFYIENNELWNRIKKFSAPSKLIQRVQHRSTSLYESRIYSSLLERLNLSRKLRDDCYHNSFLTAGTPTVFKDRVSPSALNFSDNNNDSNCIDPPIKFLSPPITNNTDSTSLLTLSNIFDFDCPKTTVDSEEERVNETFSITEENLSKLTIGQLSELRQQLEKETSSLLLEDAELQHLSTLLENEYILKCKLIGTLLSVIKNEQLNKKKSFMPSEAISGLIQPTCKATLTGIRKNLSNNNNSRKSRISTTLEIPFKTDQSTTSLAVLQSVLDLYVKESPKFYEKLQEYKKIFE
ncbi:hypothetical protein Zmor_019111 [Zophobas morio]|jgi:hypothetical protein|uniref:Uncharacterized protein n=1 Tax=Zophobas morio TaxID=2755281 RepID=A0AA38HJU0_9CUCU|nr:hypothetical protein Zmor_019111 [Zophobas morio]